MRWTGVANSSLRPVLAADPTPVPYGNPQYIMDYSGASFDAQRRELVVWGGGHGDYPGNEVVAFSLESGKWAALTLRDAAPYDPSGSGSDTTDALPSGHPAARHTYGSLVRVNLPGWDGFFVHGGSLSRLGYPTARTWFFHRDTLLWESLVERPNWGESDYGKTSIAVHAAFDPVTNRVVIRGRNAGFWYDFALREFVLGVGYAEWQEGEYGSAFDVERGILVMLGKGRFETWDVRTTPWTLTSQTTGGIPQAERGPGLIFDPVGKQYIAYTTGQTLYGINRDTWLVTALSVSGADPGPRQPDGTFGRFAYDPVGHQLILTNDIDGGVFVAALEAGVPPLPPSPPPGPSPTIPDRTWVRLPLPPRVFGDARDGAITDHDKHVSLAWCPDNGRIYFEGGDYYGTSYRQETWSLDARARLVSPDPKAGWVLEYPYCGPSAQVQPKGMDFVGWTWDGSRKLFWMVPGEMQPHGRFSTLCPGEVPDSYTTDDHLIFRHIMSFDPVTRLWADYDPWPNGSDTWSAIYDPMTDTIVHDARNYDMGVYDIKSKTWTRYHYDPPVGASPNIAKGIWADDLPGRRIFMADAEAGLLYRWEMDVHRLVLVEPLPGGPLTVDTVKGDKSYLVWDSNARVLIYNRYAGAGTWAYHPDETPPRWEDLAALPIQGGVVPVQWNGVTFDRVNNWLVGLGWQGMWLFRYGAAAPLPPPPLPPTPAPTPIPTPTPAPTNPRVDLIINKPVSVDVYVNGQKVP